MSLKDRGEIHDWKYESAEFQLPVKRGTRFYKPDFTVWHSEGAEPEYWEVKGHLDAKSVTALTRMKKYHPGVTVLLIGKEQYKEIEAQSGHLEGWE
jgi:hypothetical protein